MNYRLYVFDVDGTIADRDSDDLLPGVGEWFSSIPRKTDIAFASNQGGVGLRYWMERDGFGDPSRYPTAGDVGWRMLSIAAKLRRVVWIYTSFAYQSKSSGVWGPTPVDGGREWNRDWRKPRAGMIRAAMDDAEVGRCLVVGDSEEDRLAAESAKVDFMWANDFFRPFVVKFINDEDGGELARFSTEEKAKLYIRGIRANEMISPKDTLRVFNLRYDYDEWRLEYEGE